MLGATSRFRWPLSHRNSGRKARGQTPAPATATGLWAAMMVNVSLLCSVPGPPSLSWPFCPVVCAPGHGVLSDGGYCTISLGHGSTKRCPAGSPVCHTEFSVSPWRPGGCFLLMMRMGQLFRTTSHLLVPGHEKPKWLHHPQLVGDDTLPGSPGGSSSGALGGSTNPQWVPGGDRSCFCPSSHMVV